MSPRHVLPLLAAVLLLPGCQTTDPARLEAMTPNQLMREWDDWKNEAALSKMVEKNIVAEDEVPLIKRGTIRVGMSKNALFAARTPTYPEYSDASGAEVYEYNGTYVKVLDGRVVDWWDFGW